MNTENAPATVKVVAASDAPQERAIVGIYKATLEFLGKLAVPGAILLVALYFGEEIKGVLKGIKVSSIETPIGKIDFFEEVIEGLASNNPLEQERAVRKVETAEEVVAAEIEAGVRPEIPTRGEPAKAEIDFPNIPAYSAEWKTVLGVSWVKPNDWLGRTYFLSVEDEIFIWPIEIDFENKQAKFIVNNSSSSRSAGKQIVQSGWVKEGAAIEFVYDKNTYRLNLIDIRNAGKIKSKATFISVDQKV